MALFADSFGKLVQVPPVVEATVALGYPRESVLTLGIILGTWVRWRRPRGPEERP